MALPFDVPLDDVLLADPTFASPAPAPAPLPLPAAAVNPYCQQQQPDPWTMTAAPIMIPAYAGKGAVHADEPYMLSPVLSSSEGSSCSSGSSFYDWYSFQQPSPPSIVAVPPSSCAWQHETHGAITIPSADDDMLCAAPADDGSWMIVHEDGTGSSSGHEAAPAAPRRRPRLHHCPYCSHTSNRANNMKEHVLTHDPHRPKNFACPLCGKRFARKHDMKRHTKSPHHHQHCIR